MNDFIKNLREKILKLLKENPNGLTMSKIANELGITIYMLNKELSVLENQKFVQIIDVGASKLVRLK